MKKENKFEKIKTIIPHRGHTLFKVNNETLEITKAIFTTLPMKNKDGEFSKNKKVIFEKGFNYISALNKKNVRKTLDRMLD